jgi:hypothetical protein
MNTITTTAEFKEIARIPGGNSMDVHAALERETTKAQEAGWTKIGVTIADFHFILLGIPPAAPTVTA